MSSSTQPKPPRPTLEDLLRFKRAERPSPEFWAEFDRGLRQKQLAALMKRPKGWARWSPVFVRSLRWAVPATAATAVALVVVQIPLSTASKNQPVEVASRPAIAAEEAVRPVAQHEPDTTLAQQEDHRQHVTAVVRAVPEAPVEAATAREIAVAEPTRTEQLLPWSAATLSSGSNFRMGAVTMASITPAPEVRRPRSSWTSRFNEITRELGAPQESERMLQLASLNLPVSTQSSLEAGAPTFAAAGSAPRPRAERDFRDLESRFGVTGSSLSIKF